MVYKAIGIMSGSSLDGLDITFAELTEQGGNWDFAIKHASCIPYNHQWLQDLNGSVHLPAKEYLLLHVAFGKYIGQAVNAFIKENHLQHQVNLVAVHGHTTFHLPEKNMTHQLGDGATIAEETQLPVVSDLRSLDIAFGGQGAPIVPLGESLLFHQHAFFLNLGGIANISIHNPDGIIGFDVCACNRVLNFFAGKMGLPYDDGGAISAEGNIDAPLLSRLNDLAYFRRPAPKSLANSFGNEIISIINSFDLAAKDALRTYTEHICIQVTNALRPYTTGANQQLLVTGGGAFNSFLMETIAHHIEAIHFNTLLPPKEVIQFKEALIMALLGTLRWREQYTVLASVTGATRNSIGGALWLGSEA